MTAAPPAPEADIDRYHAVALQHRRTHGCEGYPFDDGRRLQALVREHGSRRVLELGTAVGYSAFCFASAAPGVTVDSVEREVDHVSTARRLLEEFGVAESVHCHLGDFATVLGTLRGPYDLTFVDGFEPDPALCEALLAVTSGVLVSANLSWSRTADAYLARLDDLGWHGDRRGDIAISTNLREKAPRVHR